MHHDECTFHALSQRPNHNQDHSDFGNGGVGGYDVICGWAGGRGGYGGREVEGGKIDHVQSIY